LVSREELVIATEIQIKVDGEEVKKRLANHKAS